jgi:hypothetical protein
VPKHPARAQASCLGVAAEVAVITVTLSCDRRATSGAGPSRRGIEIALRRKLYPDYPGLRTGTVVIQGTEKFWGLASSGAGR